MGFLLTNCGQEKSAAPSYGNEVAPTATNSPAPSSSPNPTSSLGQLKIHATFDSTITSDAHAALIEATINAVIAEYEAHFGDPITVNITFKQITTGLGSSNWSYYIIPYTAFRAALVNTATSSNDFVVLAHLPATTASPVLGQSSVMLTTANYKALNPNISNSNTDGTVGINLSICNLDRLTISPGLVDLASVVAHEIDEVLGLKSGLDVAGNSHIMPVDLFRYDQNGNHSYTSSSTALSYFSLDGITHLMAFNQNAAGDYADWVNGPTPHVQDAWATAGVTIDPNIEYTALDVIGYQYIP